MDEFITDKWYNAKLVSSRTKYGPAYVLMVEYEAGWKRVLCMVTTSKSMNATIERIKIHY